MRAAVAFVAALWLLTAAAADAGWQQARASGATARAYAIRVVVPNQQGAETPTVTAPEDSVVFGGSFDYNKLVTSGTVNASASAAGGPSATATASAEADDLSLFGGEITAKSEIGRASCRERVEETVGMGAAKWK